MNEFTEKCSFIMFFPVSVIIFLFCVYFWRNLSESVVIRSETSLEPSLLVVSFDGFRPDYLNRNVTPNLNKFRKDGVSAEFMRPVFPTKTFVNHFTIATVSDDSD